MQGGSLLIMLVLMVGLMYFMSRSQKKQYQKRMESLNKLQKGNEVITIGGLYGTIDEVDTDRKTVVLDVDGVYLTFELGAIKTDHQRRGKGLFFGGQIGRCDEGKPCWFKKEARVPILWGFMV